MRTGLVLLAAVLLAAQAADEPTAVQRLQAESRALRPLVTSELAHRFLAATDDLPAIPESRVIYWDRTNGRALTPAEAARVGEEQLRAYEKLELGEDFYYYTAYGSPLAYCRALDLASAAGLRSAEGARIVDFGFGSIGQLRLLASLGANVVGIDIMELLEDFYREPGDTGRIQRSGAVDPGPPGSLALIYGSFPADRRLRDVAGRNVDLFIAKNVLKKGYIHPEREADPSRLVNLGVDDETFVKYIYDMLRPGGLFVIYNLYPPQSPPDEPYIPHATGGCPFDRAIVEFVGFDVVAFDTDDTEAARAIGAALGWDEQSMNLETDLYAMYTVLRKPGS